MRIVVAGSNPGTTVRRVREGTSTPRGRGFDLCDSAALCSEKAVTFHKQCGSDWLGSGRIYFLEPRSPRIFADSRDDQNPPQRHRAREISSCKFSVDYSLFIPLHYDSASMRPGKIIGQSLFSEDPYFAFTTRFVSSIAFALRLEFSNTRRKTLATTDYSLAHTLPANVEAERSILGAILLDNLSYNQAAEHLKPEDFSLDSHRRIYTRMVDLAESSRPIDMITLVEELDRRKELEAIGDVGYVSGLLDGVPDRPSIEHYIKIVRDKALLRGLIHAANVAIARAAEQSDPAEEVLNDAEAAIMQLSEKRIGRGFLGVQEIVKESLRFGGCAVAAGPAHHGTRDPLHRS